MAALSTALRVSRRLLRVPLLPDLAPSEPHISAIRRRAVATAASSPSTVAAAATAPTPSTDPSSAASPADAAATTSQGVMGDGAAPVRPKVGDQASLVEARMQSLVRSAPATDGLSSLHGYSSARGSSGILELPHLDSADGCCLPHLDDYVPIAALSLGTIGVKSIPIPFAKYCTTMGFQTRPKVIMSRHCLPNYNSHGRHQSSSSSSGSHVITQLLYSNPEEIPLCLKDYATAHPLVYEVVPKGLIRRDDISDPDTSKYMQSESGTSLADQFASLIVVNLQAGINIGPLLREDNVRIYPSNCCLQIISTEMTQQTGKVSKAEPYAAGAALYNKLLDYSVGGGLIRSELPGHVVEFIQFMENATPRDLRTITNHSATFTPQVRMSFRLQAELYISHLLPSIDLAKQGDVLIAMPYIDTSCVTCIQDMHPAFAAWLAQSRKFTLVTWNARECGHTVVKVHRHGTVHCFGPYLKGHVSTISDPISVDALLTYRMPLYPSRVVNVCVQEKLFPNLDMGRIRPEKAGYCNFTY
ncbi:uncharacterized protein LOC119367405 [Triticum dicoccoides]|uniref:uncharacterized protein LOC119367405 n=1 Tax=Triticum dicoccoides TaxID=85692 RepID=UPI001890ADE8|nr:uncharacterized protein LOC119367405 [Triticum dicoccoides]